MMQGAPNLQRIASNEVGMWLQLAYGIGALEPVHRRRQMSPHYVPWESLRLQRGAPEPGQAIPHETSVQVS